MGLLRLSIKAELAGYYPATWQWHYSVRFPSGIQVDRTKYDIFAGISIGVNGPGLARGEQ
jgi:hypothetical protein